MSGIVHGWVAPGWEGVREAFAWNLTSGAEAGAGFAAYHRGRPVVDLWGGVADQTSGRPWTRAPPPKPLWTAFPS